MSEGQPVSVAGALAMLDRALSCLTAMDTAGLPTAVRAAALLALEKAEARHTAARARLLASFAAQGGYEDDGHGSARTWLRWRARITAGAAAGAVGWARRLAAHPVIAAELAAGELSESYAREFCSWTDRLPEDQQADADEILASAARAGQPAQAHLHITLAELRGSAGASGMEAAWFAARASQPGWLTGPDAEAAACDVTLVPIVTGHVDQTALDRLTEFYLTTHGLRVEDAESQGEPPGAGILGGADTEGQGGGPRWRAEVPRLMGVADRVRTARRARIAATARPAGAATEPVLGRPAGCLDAEFGPRPDSPLDDLAPTPTLVPASPTAADAHAAIARARAADRYRRRRCADYGRPCSAWPPT